MGLLREKENGWGEMKELKVIGNRFHWSDNWSDGVISWVRTIP